MAFDDICYSIGVIDFKTGNSIFRIFCHSGLITYIAVNSEKIIISASEDKTIIISNLAEKNKNLVMIKINYAISV